MGGITKGILAFLGNSRDIFLSILGLGIPSPKVVCHIKLTLCRLCVQQAQFNSKYHLSLIMAFVNVLRHTHDETL